MTGFLVVNHFLMGKKYETLHSYMLDCAKKLDIELELRTNQEIIFEEKKVDFALFWDKDINAARLLENRGVRVFNSSRSIALCDDKAKTYLALDGIVKQPETIIAPLSFFESDYGDFVDKAIERLGLPLVFKECFGSFGEQVFLCKSKGDILSHITAKPFLLQKFIEKSCGRDVRIEVVGGECVAAMKRFNDNDFRSNITNGGCAEAYTPTKSECEAALRACEALGLTFGGVDILDGNLVCEVNSNAHIINLMNTTGIDVAEKIFEAIKI